MARDLSLPSPAVCARVSGALDETVRGCGGVLAAASVRTLQAQRDELTTGLSDEERRVLDTTRLDRRRTEFVGGRMLLKSCVAQVLERAGQPRPALERIGVLRNEDGSPRLLVDGDEAPDTVGVSISHCRTYVFCGAVWNASLGLDVECVSDRLTRVRGMFVSDEEQQVLDRLSGAGDEERLTRLWTAKEAVAKHQGTNLLAALAHCSLQRVRGDQLVLAYENGPDSVSLSARTLLHDGCVFAAIAG